MIRNLRIQNFRCLRDVTLELGELTVLVGPNGSGKTALADVLAPSKPVQPSDFWRKSSPWCELSGTYSDGGTFRNRIEPPGDWFKVPNLESRRQVLQPGRLKKHNEVVEAAGLDATGSNLANAFGTLTRKQQEAFVREFCALVPYYGDVQARPSKSGRHRLVFEDKWDSSVIFEPEEVSDGTILSFALLFIAHHEPSEQLLVLEDPDHGLHPYLVGQVVSLLRKLAGGELGGRAIQVVLTTHSASLLNHLHPQEVRFLSRDLESGETRIDPAPVDDSNWATVYEEYQRSLGDLWLSGAIGGVPGA